MILTFCTLFDHAYLTRGLALYRSLVRHCSRPFTLSVLCMSEPCRLILDRLALPGVRLLGLADLGDAELVAAQGNRGVEEFFWTCTAPLLRHMLRDLPEGGVATYLDADLMFFADPALALDEIEHGDILIHEHAFHPDYARYEATSGRFNVGLVGVRNSEQGRACLERWRAQCLDACVKDADRGLCGDQKYLDEWPDLWSGTVVLTHPGAGVAPWNIHRFALGQRDGAYPTVDGRPLVFYHFHQMRVLRDRLWGRMAVQAAYGYSFTPAQLRMIYRPYVAELRRGRRNALSGSGADVLPSQRRPWKEILDLWRRGDVVIG